MISIPATTPRITAADLGQSALSKRAMTVSLHLSAWGAQRLDRATTKKVLKSEGAAQDAGKFHKLLVPKEALDPITTAHARAGARHRAMTLPWGEGSRILSAPAFFDYSQAMREERTNCERAHSDFFDAYPEILRAAPDRMGPTLFKAAEFPSPQEIVKRFAFRLVILPLPHEDDFRVNLGDEIEAEIRREIEATVTSRSSEAQADLWKRLLTTVRHFATTMAEEGKTFQYTTLTNLTDIATLAPKLSLSPDPVLDAICADILAITDACDAEALRASRKVRGRAAEDAAAALRRIETAMQGAF